MKVKVVKSETLANALVWLGFEYKREENNWIFERSREFDVAWKNIHCLRSRLNEYRERR